jgi:hypothetical protein
MAVHGSLDGDTSTLTSLNITHEEKSQYEEKDKSSTWYCILCNQVLYCPPKKGRCWAFRSIGRTTGA